MTAIGSTGSPLLNGFLAARLGPLERLFGGWNWPALLVAVLDSMLTVFGSVWLVQGVAFIGLAVALRQVPASFDDS